MLISTMCQSENFSAESQGRPNPQSDFPMTASETVGRFLRLGIVLVTFCALSSTHLFAQISEEEHLSHHPEEAAAKAAGKDQKEGEKATGGMMGGGMGGMMGKGGMMDGMMEKMGAPKDRELYPELMSLPDLPAEKRTEVQNRAHQRMRDGVLLIAEGVGELADATPTDDFEAMQQATDRVKRGLAQFDSGLAAHRALAEGSEPRNVALQWFRKEMNLVGGNGGAVHENGVLGMSVFHFVPMASLIVFAAVMLAMYFFKMRRATRLIEDLAARPSALSSPELVPTAAPSVERGSDAPPISNKIVEGAPIEKRPARGSSRISRDAFPDRACESLER